MSFPDCTVHNMIQNIIFCSQNSLSMECYECFRGYEGATGLILKEQSKNGFLEWNQFLTIRFNELKVSLKNRGYTSLFQLKLDPQHPKGSISQISNQDIDHAAIIAIETYIRMLEGNLQFVNKTLSLRQLQINEFLKDLYTMFIFDINKNLSFLIQGMEKQLRNQQPQKQIYNFIRFTLIPRQVRSLEMKRKQIIKKIEDVVIVKIKAFKSPILIKSRVSNASSEQPKTPKNIFTPKKLINQPKGEVEELKQKLKDRQTSIQYLNNLIGNEEQQLAYRENEVEMLTMQVQKLMKFKSSEHPKLTAKLVEKDQKINELSQKYSESQQEINRLKQEMKMKEKSIKQLHNLIGNEEQQLCYRENEVQTLSEEIKKLMQYKNRNPDEQLLAEVIELEADVAKRNEDIAMLSKLLNQIGKYVPETEVNNVKNTLSNLKSIKLLK